MKKGILFLFILAGFAAKSQSLKELLYSGKLKADSNSVIRKGDDLSSKIDTSTKKAAEPERTKIKAAPDEAGKKAAAKSDAATAGEEKTDTSTVAGTVKDNAAPVKSNNKIWKAYTDSLLSTLKTEVLPSKKIKKDTYYLTVDYEIGADGSVTINSVGAEPENAFLQDQVKERLTITPPALAPVLDSNNQPRKVKRKYSFSITKE